ncbi:hypothetical protein TcasGA2_TC034292 [Tribolium castaneum]|uniref:RNA-directed DNA polymerase n=1 Tax=Tribolium castaneum TaxID=7070 RepID=A0A139WCC5_TRICA|nr:hypothetical protein TcasGA2_TC034292 [Tribolium castaneum]
MFGLNGFGNESPILGPTTNSDTRNYLTMDTTSSGLDERRQRSTRGNEDDADNTGLSPVLQDQIAKVNFEREMLEREKDLLRKTLPDFDPGSSKTALTAIQWIRKVETIAGIYGWDSKTTLFHAMNRLNGAARFWFHGLEESLTDWNTFKTKLVEDFPVIHDDADIHFELSNRKKKFNESYETYVYTMKSIASKGTVSEQAVTKYIIMGLGDRELAKMLNLNDIRTTQDLLKRILQYVTNGELKQIRKGENNMIITEDIPGKDLPKAPNIEDVLEIVNTLKIQQMQAIYNSIKLEEQLNDMRKKTNQVIKSISKIDKRLIGRILGEDFKTEWINDKYFTTCPCQETVDMGTQTCSGGVKYIDGSLFHYDKAPKDCKNHFMEEPKTMDLWAENYNLSLELITDNPFITSASDDETWQWLVELKEKQGNLSLNNFEGGLISLLIVPDDSQEDSMIVGRSALAQTGIRVITEGDKLSIEKVMSVSVSTNPLDDIHCNPELSKTDQEQLIQLVNDFKTCFASNLHELGTTDLIDMNIKLTNNKEVVRYRPYRLPYAQREEVDKIVDEMLSAGIISDSNSEYSSPVLLVKKKDGSNRLCIDYRRLNAITVKEYVPMQIIDEQLDLLSGNGYFTTLDLASGYMQVPVAKESRHLTSFVTTTGQYEFNRMPFGLVNAPSVFNRLMNMVTRKIGRGVVTIYMDDILIPSKTVGKGLEKLTLVLKTIRDLGLTLKLSKCRFLFTKLEYLGYEIDANGVRPSSRKVNAITDFPRPTNVHEVRQFLGLCNFFRRFVQDYAKIARHLTLLTKNDQRFIWSEDQANAFLPLKKILSEKPILSLYDPTAEFQVYCDASKQGLAGTYLQKKKVDAVWKPVCYFSRQTTEDEKKFHSYELEALAVVESLDRFRVYLLGRKFTVITDCNSLKTMMTKRDMSPRLGRWFLKLQEYDFDIQHRAGSRMQHVDALSRNPTEPSREVEVADAKIYSLRIDMSDWLLTMQLQDKKIVDIYETLKRKPTTNIEKQIHTDYSIENNRVCRKIGTNVRWVVPKPVIWKVIQSCHDDMGHCGVDRTVSYLQKYFWFPKMRKKVQTYINSCIRCAYHKAQKGKPEGELHRIERTPIPFHTCNIDHLGPFVSSNRESYVLHYQDNFTKYAVFRATRNTKSKPVIDALKDIFAVFGAPTRLICDRGTAFTSKEFTLFCEENQITLIKSATATPRANGQVERNNQTLLEALRTTFNREDYKDWSQHLRNLQFALNAHKNKTTQMSPHDLLFSYHPRNAVQNQLILALGEPDDEINLEEAREEAVRKIHRQQAKDKQRFDEKHKRPTEYVEDDLVLITRLEIRCASDTFALSGQGQMRFCKTCYSVAQVRAGHNRCASDTFALSGQGQMRFCKTCYSVAQVTLEFERIVQCVKKDGIHDVKRCIEQENTTPDDAFLKMDKKCKSLIIQCIANSHLQNGGLKSAIDAGGYHGCHEDPSGTPQRETPASRGGSLFRQSLRSRFHLDIHRVFSTFAEIRGIPGSYGNRGLQPSENCEEARSSIPSPVDNEIDTGNRFSSLSNGDDFEPTPSDVENGEESEMEERRKKKKSSSPKPSPRTATWASVAAAPKCSTSAAPKCSSPAAPRISIPAAPRVSPPTAPQGSAPKAPQGSSPTAPQGPTPAAPKASRIPPIFLRDAGKWNLVSQKVNFTKARSVSDQIRIQPATVADFRLLTRFMEAERIPFHTFTLPKEKTTRVVLRGIPVQVSTNEVFADLKRQGFNLISTQRMHTGKRQLPLVLLEAPLDQAKEVWKMKTVCSLMVKVEKPKKSGKAAQSPGPESRSPSGLRSFTPSLLHFHHDIPKTDRTTLAIYADDTAILTRSKQPYMATRYLQESVERIENWCRRWLINVNPDKSRALLLARRRVSPDGFVRMFNADIPWSDQETMTSCRSQLEIVSLPGLHLGSPQGSTPTAPQSFTPAAPQSSTPAAHKASRIPPIFLRDAGKWHLVSQNANFTKARSVSDQIRIQPATVADFRSFTRFMDAERIPFHTFSLPEEKTTHAVLREIPVQGFNPISTHRMHTGKKQLPLVLLEAPLDQAKKVWKMKTVCSLMVKVEKPRKSGKAAQCHRCEGFFHAQRTARQNTDVSSEGKHCVIENALSLRSSESDTIKWITSGESPEHPLPFFWCHATRHGRPACVQE